MGCIFCEFSSGKRKYHNNGFPLVPISKTTHTLSFLSIDFPDKEDGHTILIPRKHYRNLSALPPSLLKIIAVELQTLVNTINTHHDGCNVLLNEGAAADQTINHVHFHIIPRDKGDKIKIEVWKRKKISKARFIEVSEILRKTNAKMRVK